MTDLLSAEAIGLTQHGRAKWALQIAPGLAAAPDDVNMLGCMVVRIDHHPEPVEAIHGRHDAR